MNNLKQIGIQIFDQWTELWNKNLILSEEIIAPCISLHYAQADTEAFDKIQTPVQLSDMITFWHQKRSGIVFKTEGEPVVDLIKNNKGICGLVARPYHVSFIDETGKRISRSGTDILKIVNGKIQEVWSVSSGALGRTFYREQ
jgi:hypothetical protein